MRRALLLLPIALAAIIFHEGFDAWFQQDDFAHLKLAKSTPVSRLTEMALSPVAQGTFRPLSERLFFWSIYRCCQLDAFPARLFAFALQSFNLILLGLLLRRLTGSPFAAACGAVFWAVNPLLTVPMTWIAATNQLMAASCFLSAAYCFVLYCDTSRRRWLLLSWTAFILCFGVLEITVVIPAILTAYASLFARTHWKAALGYWPPAVAFAVWHSIAIPNRGGATYQLVFDSAIFQTLATYFRWAVYLDSPAGLPSWIGYALIAAGAAALWRCDVPRSAWFGAAWFLAAIAPVLPLKHHQSDYYLTVPAIGLSIVIASMALVPRAVFVVLYLVPAILGSLAYATENTAKSHDVQAIVFGAKRIAELHPGKVIYLSGITEDMFWFGIFDHPFSLVGASGIHIVPEDVAKFTHNIDTYDRGGYTTLPETFSYLVQSGDAVVYAFENRRFKEVTDSVALAERRHGRAPRLRQILAGEEGFQSFMGPEWYRADRGLRWMPRTATTRLLPDPSDNTIVLRGICANEQVAAGGPVRVAVEWNGAPLGEQPIPACPGKYELRFQSPKPLGESGQLRITASPEIQIPGDKRRLALAVVSIESRANP